MLNDKKSADYTLPQKVLKDAIIGTNGYRDYFNVENEKFKEFVSGIKS